MKFRLSISPRRSVGSVPLAAVFGDCPMALFSLGREALAALLSQLGLVRGDSVTILTTSGSRYISSCVTETIERFCGWNREIDDTTRAAVVIHEWGFPLSGMAELAQSCSKRGVVLIEDCAYALGTYLDDASVGRDGDYALFSLPKFFATGFGGVLTWTRGLPLPASTSDERFVVESPEAIIARRREVWRLYVDAFECEQYPDVASGVPGVFLLRCADRHQDLKPYLQSSGVEAGFWYGNEYLFLPCHQQMTKGDVAHIRDLVVAKVGDVRLY